MLYHRATNFKTTTIKITKQVLNFKHHSDPPKFYPAFSLITKSPSLLRIPSYINPFENNRGERHKIMLVTLKTKSYY